MLIGLQTGYQLQCFFLRHIDSYDWAGDLSFLPLIGLEYDFGKSLLSSSLAFSLLSVINRPPWTIYDDELDMMLSKSLLSILFRGEPAFVDRYFRITWRIHWDARLSPHLRLITGGALQCIRTTEPQDAIFFSSSVEVGIRYVF